MQMRAMINESSYDADYHHNQLLLIVHLIASVVCEAALRDLIGDLMHRTGRTGWMRQAAARRPKLVQEVCAMC